MLFNAHTLVLGQLTTSGLTAFLPSMSIGDIKVGKPPLNFFAVLPSA